MAFDFSHSRPQGAEGSFFARSIRASAWIALLAGLFAAVYVDPGFAGRYLLFAFWMLANLCLWRLGAKEILGPRRLVPIIVLGGLKILWLAFVVGLCATMGIQGPRQIASFLLGINTPFLVVFLKALGLALTRKYPDEAISNTGSADDADLAQRVVLCRDSEREPKALDD